MAVMWLVGDLFIFLRLHELRQWNEIADQKAREAASLRLQGSARQMCAEARRRAYQWEMGTLQAGARIATAYVGFDAT